MRIFSPRDATEHLVEGIHGALRSLNIVDSEDLVCGLRVIEPNAKAPRPTETPSNHHHLVYAIKGTGTVSNGEYYEKVNPGAFVLFEGGEKPYYQTGDADLVVLEVAWKPANRKAVPIPVAQAALHAVRPKAVATTGAGYQEV